MKNKSVELRKPIDFANSLGLEPCDFSDCCDYCDSPKFGSFASISRGSDFTEVDYYVCGACILKKQKHLEQNNEK